MREKISDKALADRLQGSSFLQNNPGLEPGAIMALRKAEAGVTEGPVTKGIENTAENFLMPETRPPEMRMP